MIPHFAQMTSAMFIFRIGRLCAGFLEIGIAPCIGAVAFFLKCPDNSIAFPGGNLLHPQQECGACAVPYVIRKSHILQQFRKLFRRYAQHVHPAASQTTCFDNSPHKNTDVVLYGCAFRRQDQHVTCLRNRMLRSRRLTGHAYILAQQTCLILAFRQEFQCFQNPQNTRRTSCFFYDEIVMVVGIEVDAHSPGQSPVHIISINHDHCRTVVGVLRHLHRDARSGEQFL